MWITTNLLPEISNFLSFFGFNSGYVFRSTQPDKMDVYQLDGDIETLHSLTLNFNTIPLQYNSELRHVTTSSNRRLRIYVLINNIPQVDTEQYFNPLNAGDDKTLSGLMIKGEYKVLAVHEDTYETGYIEFELE